jgi:hypothetical protein
MVFVFSREAVMKAKLVALSLSAGLAIFGAACEPSLFLEDAEANTVTFSAPLDEQNTSFADGTFSQSRLGPGGPAGFFTITSTSAFNGYGNTPATVFFTTPVELESLTLSSCASPPTNCANDPTSVTVDLYNSSDQLLASDTLSPFGSITFDQSGVSSLVIASVGGWYEVSDITFATTPLPTTWSLMLPALIGVGFFAYRGTKKGRSAVAAA